MEHSYKSESAKEEILAVLFFYFYNVLERSVTPSSPQHLTTFKVLNERDESMCYINKRILYKHVL